MADNKWPVLRFHFSVNIPGAGNVHFHEVSGLEQEVDVVEYRYGADKNFYMQKLPGLVRYPNLVCKKGVYKGDTDLSKLFEQLEKSKKFYSNGSSRQGISITVVLLDAKGSTIMTWTLEDAFPIKYTSPEMKADASEVAIEHMEFSYEHMTIS